MKSAHASGRPDGSFIVDLTDEWKCKRCGGTHFVEDREGNWWPCWCNRPEMKLELILPEDPRYEEARKLAEKPGRQ